MVLQLNKKNIYGVKTLSFKITCTVVLNLIQPQMDYYSVVLDSGGRECV